MSLPASFLVLYNNVAYCLALVLLLSLLTGGRALKFISAFILIVLAGLLLTPYPNLIMPVTVCVLTVCFSGLRRKKIIPAFRQCLTAVFIAWCVIMLISCVCMAATPDWHGGVGCNLLTGALLVCFALALRLIPGIAKWSRRVELTDYAIMLELLIVLFFSFVLPQFYPQNPVLTADDKRQIGIICLSFMAFLLMVGFLICRMQRMEHERREIKAYIQQQKDFRQQVQYQFDTVITLKHYYSKLYHGIAPFIRDDDMAGLQAYFERHIASIHRSRLEDRGQLTSIRNEVIKNLLDVTVAQVDALENISLELEVDNKVRFPEDMEMDLFEIMCNLLDNAMRELGGQAPGLLRIVLRGEAEAVSITVANTLHASADIEKLYQTERRGRHGYGLNRVRKIVYRHPGMEHFTYKGGMYRGKEILVQQIKVEGVKQCTGD